MQNVDHMYHSDQKKVCWDYSGHLPWVRNFHIPGTAPAIRFSYPVGIGYTAYTFLHPFTFIGT